MIRIFLLLILLSTNCLAQEYSWLENGVYKENSYSKVGLSFHHNTDKKNVIFVHILLKRGWKTFWKNPGDAGSPITLDWKNSENIKDVKLKWPAPTRFIENIAEGVNLEVWGYKDEVLFPVEITADNVDKEGKLNIDISYTVCNKLCIPQNAKFSVILPTLLPDSFQNARAKEIARILPAKNGDYGLEIGNVYLEKGHLQVAVEASSENGFENPDVFIHGINGAKFHKPKIELFSKDHKEIVFRVNYEINIPNTELKGREVEITLVDGDLSVVKNVVLEYGERTKDELSAWVFLILPVLFGFIGGVLLNVMPCVLPVISLKFLSLVEYSGRNVKYIRMTFLATALGIICSFLFFAIMTIGLKYAGLAVGWGIHFQQPIFIVTLTLIVGLFASNLCGIYEIPLPAWIGSFATRYGSKGLWGHFMTGVFTTVLATPCSAPFLGTAVGFALSHGCFEIILIFTSMGVGLAFPFILIAIHPEFVSKLPKPGKWMVKVKCFLGILLALTALWLLWVLSHQVGNVIAASVLALFLLLIAILKFAKSLYMKVILISALLVVGMYISFFVEKPTIHLMEKDVGFWHPFNRGDIPRHIKNGKVVFVKVTADWCLTCKTNKLLVLSSKKVKKALGSDNVVAMQADWTSPNQKITEYLQENDKFGIPFTIVYSKRYPNGVVLSELLTEREILEVIRKAMPVDISAE